MSLPRGYRHPILQENYCWHLLSKVTDHHTKCISCRKSEVLHDGTAGGTDLTPSTYWGLLTYWSHQGSCYALALAWVQCTWSLRFHNRLCLCLMQWVLINDNVHNAKIQLTNCELFQFTVSTLQMRAVAMSSVLIAHCTIPPAWVHIVMNIRTSNTYCDNATWWQWNNLSEKAWMNGRQGSKVLQIVASFGEWFQLYIDDHSWSWHKILKLKWS